MIDLLSETFTSSVIVFYRSGVRITAFVKFWSEVWNHGFFLILADMMWSESPWNFKFCTNSWVKMRPFASLDRLSVVLGRTKFREVLTSFSENTFVSSIELVSAGSAIWEEEPGGRAAGIGRSFAFDSSSWGLTGDCSVRGEKVVRFWLWRSNFYYTNNASCVGND